MNKKKILIILGGIMLGTLLITSTYTQAQEEIKISNTEARLTQDEDIENTVNKIIEKNKDNEKGIPKRYYINAIMQRGHSQKKAIEYLYNNFSQDYWNKQCLKSAKYYINKEGYTFNKTVENLKYDGFEDSNIIFVIEELMK